jgi:hypothetical protein
MHTRVLPIGAATAAAVLALMLARTDAFAASDKESCSTTDTNVGFMNSDGTGVTCDAGTGAPNKAKAKATDLGTAVSEAADGSTATSKASGMNAEAMSEAEDGAITKATASGENSEAVAEIDVTGGGKATSTATDGAAATAEIEASGGGEAVAAAHDLAVAYSYVDGGGGSARSDVSGDGSRAYVQAENGGTAKATARDGIVNVDALAEAPGACTATANGSGAGGEAYASCENTGSVVTAVSTKGSKAIGYDTMPPTCTPMNGGIAKVRSPMGNCG